MPDAETRFFLDWMEKRLRGKSCDAACEAWGKAKTLAPELHLFSQIPQSPPWHAEGPLLEDNILRTLTGFFALRDGDSVFTIEEIAREKTWRLAFLELEETIRANDRLFLAFILLHDIAKPACLVLDSPVSSRGAREGFIQHRKRMKPQASPKELQLYGKLLRAFAITHPTLTRMELAGRFFDAYEIHAHYPNHAHRALQGDYDASIARIGDHFSLDEEERHELTFLMWYHMDHVGWFERSEHPNTLLVLHHRAQKEGLEATRMTSLVFASLFLDSFLGTVHYEEGVFRANIAPILHFLKSEEWAMPETQKRRLVKEEEKAKQVRRRILTEAELDGESVFSLLKTPFGPERAKVLQEIDRMLEDENYGVDFGEHTKEIEKRVLEARGRFDALSRT